MRKKGQDGWYETKISKYTQGWAKRGGRLLKRLVKNALQSAEREKFNSKAPKGPKNPPSKHIEEDWIRK